MVAYIVYSDIRNHTAWAERNSPKLLIKLLEGYYELPKGNPFNFNAVSDQMAIFYKDCNGAVAGTECLRNAAGIYFKEFGLKLGVSIHKGIVEKIRFFLNGSEVNTYTSHSVCIAARLSRLSENGEIIISKDVYDDLKNGEKTKFEANGSFDLKGRNDLIETFVKF